LTEATVRPRRTTVAVDDVADHEHPVQMDRMVPGQSGPALPVQSGPVRVMEQTKPIADGQSYQLPRNHP
jgi:hypothetical protein